MACAMRLSIVDVSRLRSQLKTFDVVIDWAMSCRSENANGSVVVVALELVALSSSRPFRCRAIDHQKCRVSFARLQWFFHAEPHTSTKRGERTTNRFFSVENVECSARVWVSSLLFDSTVSLFLFNAAAHICVSLKHRTNRPSSSTAIETKQSMFDARTKRTQICRFRVFGDFVLISRYVENGYVIMWRFSTLIFCRLSVW